jgi:hypothetical protein
MSLFRACLLSIAIFIGVCHGASLQENRAINITFRMDGKLKPAPKFIEVRTEAGALIIQSEIKNSRFELPGEALREPVVVIFQFQGRKMVFDSIYPIKFESETWEVEIKRPPFDQYDYLFKSDPRKPTEAWFIHFNDGTFQTVVR